MAAASITYFPAFGKSSPYLAWKGAKREELSRKGDETGGGERVSDLPSEATELPNFATACLENDWECRAGRDRALRGQPSPSEA